MVAHPSQATEDVHPQRHVNNDVITPQSDDAVSRRADNLFKSEDGKMAVIDWQLYQSGPGGVEFEQLVGMSSGLGFCDLYHDHDMHICVLTTTNNNPTGVNGAPKETHAAMKEVFATYHRTLVEYGPPGVGELKLGECTRNCPPLFSCRLAPPPCLPPI